MVSWFGWSAVSLSRPKICDRTARSGGQDWPNATAEGGCLDGREHGASRAQAGRAKRHTTVDETLIGDLFGRLPRTADGRRYFWDRRDLGFDVSLAWEGDLVSVVRRGVWLGVFATGSRNEGPLMRMVTQWCCNRSSNASTRGFFWNRSYHAGKSKFEVMIVDVRRYLCSIKRKNISVCSGFSVRYESSSINKSWNRLNRRSSCSDDRSASDA